MHIHGPGGVILFDIDEPMPQPDGTYIWVFTPVGGFTVAEIIAFLRSGQLYINLHTASYPLGEISGFFNLSTGAEIAPEPTPPPPLPSRHANPDRCGPISFSGNIWRDRSVDRNSPKPGI